MGSDCLGYQVQLGDAVNIEEVFNVLARGRRPSHALAFKYVLSSTVLSSYIRHRQNSRNLLRKLSPRKSRDQS
jgi:hypothetical protein